MKYTNQELISAGFNLKTYEGQDGTFLTKESVLERMPFAGKNLPDGDYITSEMNALTEVSPNGLVQMYIADADYLEGPYPRDAEEGTALLRDAVEAGQQS